jgi:hypothetical protein
MASRMREINTLDTPITELGFYYTGLAEAEDVNHCGPGGPGALQRSVLFGYLPGKLNPLDSQSELRSIPLAAFHSIGYITCTPQRLCGGPHP